MFVIWSGPDTRILLLVINADRSSKCRIDSIYPTVKKYDIFVMKTNSLKMGKKFTLIDSKLSNRRNVGSSFQLSAFEIEGKTPAKSINT